MVTKNQVRRSINSPTVCTVKVTRGRVWVGVHPPQKGVPLNITATDRKVNDKYEKRKRWRYMAHGQDVP